MSWHLITNFNQATNRLIPVAVLGMLVTFSALRLVSSVNRGVADVASPSWRIIPQTATIAPGQSIKLSTQSRGFEPVSIVWLASDDQATLAPVTGAVTTVNIPTDINGQTITITAQATLNRQSVIQDSMTINIE